MAFDQIDKAPEKNSWNHDQLYHVEYETKHVTMRTVRHVTYQNMITVLSNG